VGRRGIGWNGNPPECWISLGGLAVDTGRGIEWLMRGTVRRASDADRVLGFKN
jgi:hypothetical protein